MRLPLSTISLLLMSGLAVQAQVEHTGGETDIARTLQGSAAGVNVQNTTSTFGTTPRITIRGAASTFGGGKPLWVVDGVIMEPLHNINYSELESGNIETLLSSATAGLNVQDIEKVEVLKDGAATALYGPRGMNGVIFVTTRKGSLNKISVRYTGEFTTRMKPSYKNLDLMNSQEMMSALSEMYGKGYMKSWEKSGNTGVYTHMQQLINQYDETTGTFKLQNNPQSIAEYLRTAELGNTDWMDRMFRTSTMQNHTLSAAIGTESSRSYLSVSALSDPGWIKHGNMGRITLNFNTDWQISRLISTSASLKYDTRSQNTPGVLPAERDSFTGLASRRFDINPYFYATHTSRALDPDTRYLRNGAPLDIFGESDINSSKLTASNLVFNGRFSLHLLDGLRLNLRGAFQKSDADMKHHIANQSNQAQGLILKLSKSSDDLAYSQSAATRGFVCKDYSGLDLLETYTNHLLNHTAELSADYNTTLADSHNISAYVGARSETLSRKMDSTRGIGVDYMFTGMMSGDEYSYELPYALTQPFIFPADENSFLDRTLKTTGDINTNTLFATASYNYGQRYFLSGTYSYDQYSREKYSNNFPAWGVSAAWNASNESWWAPLAGVCSNLTLRTSYSRTGSRPAIASSYLAVYTPRTYVEGLTNEKLRECSAGISLGLFNDRILVDADRYERRYSDMIGISSTQGIWGMMNKYANCMAMNASGWELSLTTRNIATKDFDWTSTLHYTHSTNRVTAAEQKFNLSQITTLPGVNIEGYPARSLFSYNFQGLDENGFPTFLNTEGELTTSFFQFSEMDPEKLLRNLVFSGSIDPTDFGGFENTFRWKNISLGALITYSMGNVVRLAPVYTTYYDETGNLPRELNNRWALPGDEKTTSIPVIPSQSQIAKDRYLEDAYQAYNYSTQRVVKGDYVKMKNLWLSYSLPSKYLKGLLLKDASVKVEGSNLFLLYGDRRLDGNDPEFVNAGGVALPSPRQYTLTLNLGF